jgi:hypothetical protein
MKTTYICVIILILACNSKNKDSKKEANRNLLKPEIKKSQTINDNNILKHLTKIRSLNDISGLWKCVKKIDERTLQEEDLLNEWDLFIKGNSLYWLFYPCNRFAIYFRIELINDLLVLYPVRNPETKYYTSYLMGKSNDTLIIRKQAYSCYYVSQNYDNGIIRSIIRKKYNPKCLKGSWTFEYFENDNYDSYDKSDKNDLKYKIFDTLTFNSRSKTNFRVNDDTLFYFTNNKMYLYKISDLFLNKNFNKGSLRLFDLNHHGKPDYELTYFLIE